MLDRQGFRKGDSLDRGALEWAEWPIEAGQMGLRALVSSELPRERAAADDALCVIVHTVAQLSVRGDDPDGRFELFDETGYLVVA